MGFLTGAYGKLMAGRHYRQLQNRLTDVMRQLRHATRDAGNMEKSLQKQQRMAENGMRQQAAGQQQYYGSVFSQMQMGVMQKYGGGIDPQQMAKIIDGGDKAAITAAYQASQANPMMQNMQNWINQQQSMYQQQAQMQVQTQQANIQNEFEMMREMMLQPLKDLEEDLTTEKESIESQLQIAKAEYDAKKQEEKEDAKNLAPSYTAGN
jgi:hypothetical protein